MYFVKLPPNIKDRAKYSIDNPSVTGRKDIHIKYIRLSYRIRGRVVRTQRKSVVRAKVFRANIGLDSLVENRQEVNILIAMILVYSAIKIMAKGPALYSMLNPDTSSDSPSTRS